MIIAVSVYRVSDGLPLCATTDVQQSTDIHECQRYVKLIARRLAQLPDRCTLQLHGYKIHCVSCKEASFLALCQEDYPVVLAFSYLDEVQREFLLNHEQKKVEAAKRPYAFIDFETLLRRTKQRFNNTHTLSTRIQLSTISLELKLRPPYEITEQDLGRQASGGSNGRQQGNGLHHKSHSVMGNGNTLPLYVNKHDSSIWSRCDLTSVSWLVWLAALCNIFCALLNLMRGTLIASHGYQNADYQGAYSYAAVFLLACLLTIAQTYHLFLRGSWQVHWGERLAVGLIMLLVLAACHIYLLPLRNAIQTLFHMSANIASTAVALHRRPTHTHSHG